MLRPSRVWAVVVAAVLLASGSALAEDKVEGAAELLRTAEDFRVRTQAALSLGASAEERAVAPLCDGLSDDNTTVRAAAAAALGKLKLGGGDCLQKRLDEEESAAVKSVIKKALSRINAASSEEPTITDSTKYYIAIGDVTDKTGRSTKGEVAALVRKAMVGAIGSRDGWVAAPASEVVGLAKKRLSAHKSVVGFFLSPKVKMPLYVDGQLTIKMDIAIFTYPSKALKGMITATAGPTDAAEESVDLENDLIRGASENLIERLSANIEKLQ